MTHSLRIFLLRRLNQGFWLLLLMGLTTWGAWRFCRLLTLPILRSSAPVTTDFQQLQSRHLVALDSSVTVLRLAVLSEQPIAILLELNEQVRQQAQEVSLLASSGQADATTALPPSALLDQCLLINQLVKQKTTAPELSRHLAELQAQVRHLQFRVDGFSGQ